MRNRLTFLGFYGLMIFGLSDCALAQAPKRQLIVFEGSDWCARCIRLNKEVLNDSAVVAFTRKEGIEVIHVDFPQRKKLSPEVEQANAAMAERYRFQGTYPTLIVTDGGERSAGIPNDGDAEHTRAAISETLSRWH